MTHSSKYDILLDVLTQWGRVTVNRNSFNSIQENPFENVVWKMAAMLSRPQCVNHTSCRRIMWSAIILTMHHAQRLFSFLNKVFMWIYLFLYSLSMLRQCFHCIDPSIDWGTCIGARAHRGQPKSRPRGRARGCRLWFLRKSTRYNDSIRYTVPYRTQWRLPRQSEPVWSTAGCAFNSRC